ncbi:MAG: hypothetical protein GF387_03305 [Candidatus Portnoybacteria bacterium]|nr:hypothetical protein [Candidatus Portnoybacteria bacterium]
MKKKDIEQGPGYTDPFAPKKKSLKGGKNGRIGKVVLRHKRKTGETARDLRD